MPLGAPTGCFYGMSSPPGATKKKTFDRRIIDGPILVAVWLVAWPSVLQNVMGGIQGVIDHALVGNLVGYAGNAAVGVSFQIFLVVITFIMSIFTGMGVLVARHAGAGDAEAVNHVSYQAFLAAGGMALFILAPLGWVLSPTLLELVHATPEVRREALPYLRTLFVGGIGMMMFYMMAGALRAAGDAKTGLRMGIILTVLNPLLNILLIRGFGPIPQLGTMGAALGMVIAMAITAAYGFWLMGRGGLVIHWHVDMDKSWDWPVVKQLFKFGLPAGVQGVVMNIGGVLMLRFMGSLPQSGHVQAVYAVGYSELFAFITWTSVGLMGAAATVAGQNLGAQKPERVVQAVHTANKLGIGIAAFIGSLFLLIPEALFGLFGMRDAASLEIGVAMLRWLAVSGFFITTALAYTGGLTGTGDTKGPLYISIVSQFVFPLGLLFLLQRVTTLEPSHIWGAIVLGHFTRAALSIWRFRAGAWREIRIETAPSG